MLIVHQIDDFLFTIFPDIMGGGNSLIINTLENYYTYGPVKPKVTIDNDLVTIEIDAPAIVAQQADYRKTIALCEKGKYSDAKPILEKLIEKNPTYSEYHRIMGQILSDEGDQDEAIGCLIDALRWNSKNGWALLMMGNIFAKFKNDVPTALKYYDQALVANPNDYITFTNIGVNLMQKGQIRDAKRYFLESLKINDGFPNTHHALAMIADSENDLHVAFDHAIQAIKFSKDNQVLHQHAVKQGFEIAEKITKRDVSLDILDGYRNKLAKSGGTEIEIVEDENIPTAARMEFAENYKRQNHVVRYKPGYPGAQHLVMHELVHLDFVIEARLKSLNQVFHSTGKHKALFLKQLEPSLVQIRKRGITEEAISKYLDTLFSALNHQIYNTPIDLFIEDYLYLEYPRLRPVQFLSLYRMNKDGLKAVFDPTVISNTPKSILSKVKIYNLVNANQFNALFGIDLANDYKASPAELKQAQQFYSEYLEYSTDREAGEEYELVLNWAEDLQLNAYFELEGETQFRDRGSMDTFIKKLEEDPLGLEEIDPVKERAMERFLKAHEKTGLNLAVVEFMVEALRYFDEMPKQKILKIASEIALQGSHGYNPDIKDYRIGSIPGKLFSGFQILAYYYVSFALAMPEVLSQLEIPFDEEYRQARTFYNFG
jgi:tetratricopeptide (TPR) repeat protein